MTFLHFTGLLSSKITHDNYFIIKISKSRCIKINYTLNLKLMISPSSTR